MASPLVLHTVNSRKLLLEFDDSDDEWEAIDPLMELDTISNEDDSVGDSSSEGLSRSSPTNEKYPSTHGLSAHSWQDFDELQWTNRDCRDELRRSTVDRATRMSRLRALLPRLFLLLLLPLIFAMGIFNPALSFGGEDSIYVPGVGFSGFWFTLGRLKSIEDPASKNYVCFSAGCLGAVAVLNNFTVDEMACMAGSAQSAWKNGEISQYDVVPMFVDGLVYRSFARNPSCLDSQKTSRSATDVPINSPHLLARLHILTTTRARLYRIKAVMRSPTSLEELHEMLLQTTWIPGATGNTFFKNDHMDGGFSVLQHPRCSKTVHLPLDAELWLNSLNVNMGAEKAYRFWNDGLEYGL